MALLKLETKADLDKARFNILTSLLRLRQICCHPGLVSANSDDAESAKMNALLDLVEPLAAEGHKVLIFSQFVGMLSRIERELAARLGDSCRLFMLTGQTGHHLHDTWILGARNFFDFLQQVHFRGCIQ